MHCALCAQKGRPVNDRLQQIETYVETWNEADVERRHSLIEQVWAADGQYVAPSADAKGHNAISDNIVRIRQKYPDRVFCRTSDVFVHNERARFTWAMLDPAGSATIAGVDYALFAADGRIRRITCIYDRKPRVGELD